MRRYSNQTGNLDISQGTSVETRRHSADTFASAVVWPIFQSLTIAIATSLAVVAVVLSPAFLGPRAFALVCGVVGLVNIIYAIQYEVDWKNFIAWPLITGIVAWCFWAFSDGLFHIPPSPWRSVFALVFTVTACVFALWLWISLGQKLIQQSLHQERYGWEILAKLLEWRIKQPKPRPAQPMVKTGRETIPENGGAAYSAPPVENLTDIEMFLMLADEYGTLSRDDGKNTVGLMGKVKANGETLSKREWESGVQWLADYGYIDNANGGGYRWLSGASAAVALQQFTRPE